VKGPRVLLTGQTFDPETSTRAFTLALSDVGEIAFLPMLVGPLRSKAPQCAIRSTSVPPGQLAYELERGDIDVAVGYFPSLTAKNFRQRRLSTHGFVCLLRADHPARADRLSASAFLTAEHLVVQEHERSQRVVERFFEQRGVRGKVAVYSSHFIGRSSSRNPI